MGEQKEHHCVRGYIPDQYLFKILEKLFRQGFLNMKGKKYYSEILKKRKNENFLWYSEEKKQNRIKQDNLEKSMGKNQ